MTMCSKEVCKFWQGLKEGSQRYQICNSCCDHVSVVATWLAFVFSGYKLKIGDDINLCT